MAINGVMMVPAAKIYWQLLQSSNDTKIYFKDQTLYRGFGGGGGTKHLGSYKTDHAVRPPAEILLACCDLPHDNNMQRLHLVCQNSQPSRGKQGTAQGQSMLCKQSGANKHALAAC